MSVVPHTDQKPVLMLDRQPPWVLVERYCESFKDDDFRLVFRRKGVLKPAELLEISVGKVTFNAFGDEGNQKREKEE